MAIDGNDREDLERERSAHPDLQRRPLDGELHDVVFDESLRDPEDGSRRNYLKTVAFDVEIVNTGD